MYTPAKVTKKIGKESVTFYFGSGAFNIFCEHRGIELEEIQEEFKKDKLGSLADILTSAANFNLLVADKEAKYKRWHAFEWIDQISEKDLGDIMTTLEKVQMLGQSLSGNGKSPTASRGRSK